MKKGSLFLIFLVGLILGVIFMLSGCRPNKPDPTIPEEKPEEKENEEISVIEIGDVRVQLLSESIARIENKGPKGFEDRPSYIVPNRDDYNKVNYTVEERNGVALIKTSKYTVHIPEGGRAEDTYITDALGEKLWAYSDAGQTDIERRLIFTSVPGHRSRRISQGFGTHCRELQPYIILWEKRKRQPEPMIEFLNASERSGDILLRINPALRRFVKEMR